MTHQQTDIFRSDSQQLHFAELCNALYERELQELSHSALSADLLKRRIAGLSHHIRSAARQLLQHNGPLEVDYHNASWQAKQAAKSPQQRHDNGKASQWFSQFSYFGMPVPVSLDALGNTMIELDSVDRIDTDNQKLHTNKHGWFHFDGHHMDSQEKLLLVPSKISLTAACCGHSWNHRGRSQPRTLTLRELLLSQRINWTNLKKPLQDTSRR